MEWSPEAPPSDGFKGVGITEKTGLGDGERTACDNSGDTLTTPDAHGGVREGLRVGVTKVGGKTSEIWVIAIESVLQIANNW